MGLALPSQADPFSTADIRANWEKIDAAPGTHICTSTTRPSWGSSQEGRRILETNTGLEWMWLDGEWVRVAPSGILRRSTGEFAIAERTTDFTTTSNTMVKVVSVTNVVVPGGNRPIKVEVSWQKARNPTGNFTGAIYRSNTNNSGPRLALWSFPTNDSDANAGGGNYLAYEPGGLAAGSYDYSFQITAPSGTSTIFATAQSPCTITVSEI
jgi:hypothetical protein